MKQHLPTAGEGSQTPVSARLHVHLHHRAISKRRATAAPMFENVCATGTWRDTAFARIAPVFAPYHQRPKDAVT